MRVIENAEGTASKSKNTSVSELDLPSALMIYPSVDRDRLIIRISVVLTALLLLVALEEDEPPKASKLPLLVAPREGLLVVLALLGAAAEAMRSSSSPSLGTLPGCMGSLSDPAKSTNWTRTKCLLSLSGSLPVPGCTGRDVTLCSMKSPPWQSGDIPPPFLVLREKLTVGLNKWLLASIDRFE